jgi:hypothetical protein
MRKKLTDEWKERGIEQEKDYAILTNEMTRAWSGMSVQEYKQLKDLKKENLRDNMTNIELTLNQLAEVTTTGISRTEQPDTFDKNVTVARRGGGVAKVARLEYERETQRKVISPINAKTSPRLKSLKCKVISPINAKDKPALEIIKRNDDSTTKNPGQV